MGKVLMEITMSLDGYTAGPDDSDEFPLGRGGERLHDWMFTGRSAGESARFETEHFSTIGALILGRRMADLGIGPWGEDPTFHAPDLRGRAYGIHRVAKVLGSLRSMMLIPLFEAPQRLRGC